MKKSFRFVLIAVGILLFVFLTAFRFPVGMLGQISSPVPSTMSLMDFLVYLGGAGAVIAVSWLTEYFNWFPDMEAKKKKLLFFLICAGVGIGSQLIVAFVPSAIIEMITPYFMTLVVIFVYVFVSDGFHNTTKLSSG